MSQFSVDMQFDDRAVRKALQQLIKAGQNLKPVFADIGEYLIPEHEQRWENAVDADGIPWAPLKAATLARKKTTKMLYEEGDLLRGPVYNASADELEFGITDFKAPFFQFGTVNMPQRELLGINRTDENEILNILSDFLAEAWEK